MSEGEVYKSEKSRICAIFLVISFSDQIKFLTWRETKREHVHKFQFNVLYLQADLGYILKKDK